MYEKKKSISKIVISHLNMYPFFVAVLYGLENQLRTLQRIWKLNGIHSCTRLILVIGLIM